MKWAKILRVMQAPFGRPGIALGAGCAGDVRQGDWTHGSSEDLGAALVEA